ncbi:MAG TPA: hypothetical protein VMW01_01790 [Williamwhitmania sp.]|nr:hypothetical protein [Williamwhitmania sp.]
MGNTAYFRLRVGEQLTDSLFWPERLPFLFVRYLLWGIILKRGEDRLPFGFLGLSFFLAGLAILLLSLPFREEMLLRSESAFVQR